MANANGYSRMPPVATNEKDAEGIELLSEWITTQLPGRQDYDAWRLANFGSLISPEGAPGANPDGDRDSNESEFLKQTNPKDADDFYRPSMSAGADAVNLELPVLAGRRLTVETSTDLGISDPWSPWTVFGNHGIPLAVGETNSLTGPIDGPERFFRIRFMEE